MFYIIVSFTQFMYIYCDWVLAAVWLCSMTGDYIRKNVNYCKFPKYSDTQNICCNHSKIWTMWLYHTVMSPNHADRMANSVDPDQTAPLGTVWSGSTLYAQAYLSENWGSLQYSQTGIHLSRNLASPCCFSNAVLPPTSRITILPKSILFT